MKRLFESLSQDVSADHRGAPSPSENALMVMLGFTDILRPA
jgi:hypothetical protein